MKHNDTKHTSIYRSTLTQIADSSKDSDKNGVILLKLWNINVDIKCHR